VTHEELLARVQYNQGYQMGLDGYKICSALRAVVELHYPTSVSWANSLDYCMECSNWEGRNPEILREYPCSTIQAIEKELQ
jgi:hypothetical protein